MKNEYKLKVRWGDTDAAGIVFYPNFYKWMDEATHEYFAEIGFPISSLIKDKQMNIPLLETHCQFKSPLFYEDEICITTTVELVKKKVFKATHLFTRGEQPIAEGYELRAWTSFENGLKAIEIPDEIKQKMI
ncbi:acyl-CoA thioesterase [Bacillus sp. UNC438CL73TsuS30]|uniref:acyl-CoA thioesterase n=1 Tax=Bacillus sp. UNC438CL73TsuS30 TaxID=1340434 RepID=UPI00047E56BE|nr:thioesterase family protein [Bacillus sp. UNC438CL73TsuS30]